MTGTLGPLVTGEWLAQHLAESDLRVIDVRWYLDGRSGADAYRAGHIPGAPFVDLEREITGESGPGRHPLPSAEQFQAAMRRAGVEQTSRVVVYDDQGGFSAARLWWLLGYFGHRRQAVLDGGLPAWPGELAGGDEKVPVGDFEAAGPDSAMVVDRDLIQIDRVTLVDARARERFTGETEPIDRKAGHIPGAHNLPWRDNLDDSWRFLDPARLRARYEEQGVTAQAPPVVYCGSGVSACVDLLALEVAGLRGARLYPGSWSDWSSQDLPIETGDSPPRR